MIRRVLTSPFARDVATVAGAVWFIGVFALLLVVAL